MHTLLSPNDRAIGRETMPSRRTVGWSPATILLPAAIIAVAALVPAPLVLPALSILAVALGMLLAIAHWLSPAGHALAGRNWRDVAALLTFIGFAAAMMTDVPEALRAIAQIESALSVSR